MGSAARRRAARVALTVQPQGAEQGAAPRAVRPAAAGLRADERPEADPADVHAVARRTAEALPELAQRAPVAPEPERREAPADAVVQPLAAAVRDVAQLAEPAVARRAAEAERDVARPAVVAQAASPQAAPAVRAASRPAACRQADRPSALPSFDREQAAPPGQSRSVHWLRPLPGRPNPRKR